ncbi:hypothetical protein Plec18170_002633 [Paecilomyces lecythidis]
MVYYVRFLKPPKIEKANRSSLSVSTLICLTTDLGDSFLADDVDLRVTLTNHNSNVPLLEQPVSWKAGSRQLSVSLGPFDRSICNNQPVVLGIGAAGPGQGQPDQMSHESTVPLVISGWSTPFGRPKDAQTERLVERRLSLQGNHDLRIWEETGNSIARHIWDAALASIIYLQRAIEGRAGRMPSLQQCIRKTGSPLRVVELGSGCGIVGIALAELFPGCSVLLTDLPEVDDIVTRNMAVARPAPKATVDFQTLDWDEQLPEELRNAGIDLILVSDCTYNADSLPSLVHVLDALVQASPKALVLVALKRRHDSEAIFFDLMQGANFATLDQDKVALPSFGFGEDEHIENIELYTYGRKHE